ncbi:acyl-CoA:lysophosphatidylglycerol acyltransferase 1-like, partial [Pollicipes pollicipes]|uniref:acyl-CoA:lysophosphatidylglycerol acyltransferase 1-like n=1 Tax=Pollicipes pollicipes TaxID=41117 RepID=UPI001885652A
MHPYIYQCLHSARCASRVLLFLLNNLYAIPVYLVWMALLSPLHWLAPHFYWWFEGFLFHSLVQMVGILSYTAGYDLTELGDTIDDLLGDRCLFLANHQSTADVPVLMAMLSSRRYAADHSMWIMDAMFRWTHFGVVSQIRGDFFVESGKDKREKSVEELKEFLAKQYLSLDRKWILLFPEGGFLRKRREASQRFAQKQGLPHLQHVTLPRLGAARAVLDQLRAGQQAESRPRQWPRGPAEPRRPALGGGRDGGVSGAGPTAPPAGRHGRLAAALQGVPLLPRVQHRPGTDGHRGPHRLAVRPLLREGGGGWPSTTGRAGFPPLAGGRRDADRPPLAAAQSPAGHVGLAAAAGVSSSALWCCSCAPAAR